MISSHHRRSTAMRMLRLGQITINEAAQIALVSRQRVRVWCENAGLEPRKARQAWLTVILTRMNKRDRK
jgi:hypothetical protein